MKAQGLLDGVTWEEYKLANEGQTAIDVDQSFYDMVSKATGFPTDNISIMAYSENMFVDSEGLGISATDIMTIVLIVGILALLCFCSTAKHAWRQGSRTARRACCGGSVTVPA